MTNELVLNKMLEIVPKERILVNEPMKKHTTFKIGGNADLFIIVTNVKEILEVLKLAKDMEIPLTIIGNGSNVLIKDGGIRGITLKMNLDKIAKEVLQDSVIYTCGSGIPLARLVSIALSDGASGMEFAAGIPGSLGGAIYMNAGAYGSEMKNIIMQTTYIDKDGNLKTINNEEHEFKYRSTIFPKIDAIIIESKILLKKGNKTEIEAKMNENLASRKNKQPLEYPNAGSIFKRGEGFITAKLIDDCGLKGYQIGGAEVSEKHAGFIVNKGNATANDVIKLIKYVKECVKEKTGFDIEEEILIYGED